MRYHNKSTNTEVIQWCHMNQYITDANACGMLSHTVEAYSCVVLWGEYTAKSVRPWADLGNTKVKNDKGNVHKQIRRFTPTTHSHITPKSAYRRSVQAKCWTLNIAWQLPSAFKTSHICSIWFLFGVCRCSFCLCEAGAQWWLQSLAQNYSSRRESQLISTNGAWAPVKLPDT